MLVGGDSNFHLWKALGYSGVFLLSLLASGGIMFPIPSLAATCGAAGLGETIGELSGYAIRYGGSL